MNKNEQRDISMPKVVVDCVFNELALSLSEPQYYNILQILQLANNFTRNIRVFLFLFVLNSFHLLIVTFFQYLKYRPIMPVKINARAWWKYACM